MEKLSKVILGYLLFSLSSCSTAVNKEDEFVTNTSNGRPYYHLMYSLSPDSIQSIDSLSESEFYDNGGQFEVLIKQEKFPVRAPNCKGDIILRMPWTDDSSTIPDKYVLYKEIIEIRGNNSQAVAVAIELNPYVSFDNDGVYLTQCNVFFRHKSRKYIPNTEP